MQREEEMLTESLENQKESDLLGDLGVDVAIILKCILREHGRRVWIGLIWLRTGAVGGLL
jgi:hypothetical protein